MASVEFSPDEISEQASGNQSALWHVTLRWAREQTGSVDGWASFVGEQFAPSWDGMGDNASALDVARGAALNYASSADIRPVHITGDESTAVLTSEGPEQEWLDDTGTTIADNDRANELIFRSIAERRGMTLELDRDGSTFRLTFARRA